MLKSCSRGTRYQVAAVASAALLRSSDTKPVKTRQRRMRLLASFVVGVGCVSVVQVSSFAFCPLPTAVRASVGQATQTTSHSYTRPRPRGVPMPLSAADGDGWDDEDEEEGEEDEAEGEEEEDDASSEVMKKRKRVDDLDDIFSEVADRESAQPLRQKGTLEFYPMPQGRVKVDPIPGMDADDVPGKIVVDAETLAEQQIGLEKIAQQLRRERLDRETEEARIFGFCTNAEIWNSRAAMFGITVGMLTEYWTGQSLPQQIETLAQLVGLLPLDYESYFTTT